jgi:hypothetical protein
MKFSIDFLVEELTTSVLVKNPNFPSLEKLLSYVVCNHIIYKMEERARLVIVHLHDMVPTIYKMEEMARLVIAHLHDIEDIIYFQDLEWVIFNPN